MWQSSQTLVIPFGVPANRRYSRLTPAGDLRSGGPGFCRPARRAWGRPHNLGSPSSGSATSDAERASSEMIGIGGDSRSSGAAP